MIYSWLSDLIGYIPTSPTSGQNSTLIQVSGVLVIMLFVLTVDLIFSFLFNLIKKRRN